MNPTHPQTALDSQAQLFPLYRIIQFALFVRYGLQRQVAEILRQEVGFNANSHLLEGIPKKVGLCQYPLIQTDIGLTWLAAERAALFFVEQRHHSVVVEYFDTGTLEALMQSYNLRSIELVSSMNKEMSLAVENIGSIVFNQHPREFASGIYHMIESVRHHLHWLHQVIDPKNQTILSMLRSEVSADEEYSRSFVEYVLRSENFRRQAQQLLQEVASVVLAGTFLSDGIGNAGFFRITPNQFAIVQSRFLEILKVKFQLL